MASSIYSDLKVIPLFIIYISILWESEFSVFLFFFASILFVLIDKLKDKALIKEFTKGRKDER